MLTIIATILIMALLIAATAVNYLSTDIGAFLVFIALLGFLIITDRKKIRREGIILIRRTLRGRNFIDRAQKSHAKLWGRAAKLGVIIGIIFLVFGTALLSFQAYKIVSGSREAGVKLILPGPGSNINANIPGILLFPWWIWVIGIAVVIIPHEFMHGIMCRLEGVRIKSVGWILLLVIPGAFVEPDEKQLQKAKRSTKLKVYAAGSFANIMIAAVIFIILASISSISFAPAGLAVAAVNNSPANMSGLHGAIMSIDNHDIRSATDLNNTLSLYRPGDTVTIRTVDVKYVAPKFRLDVSPKPVAIAEKGSGTYTITLSQRNDTMEPQAYLGVVPLMEAYSTPMDPWLYSSASFMLLWIYTFSLGIGIVNLLPLKPLDGGLIFEEIVGRFTKRKKQVAGIASVAMLLLLLFNLLGPFMLNA